MYTVFLLTFHYEIFTSHYIILQQIYYSTVVYYIFHIYIPYAITVNPIKQNELRLSLGKLNAFFKIRFYRIFK